MSAETLRKAAALMRERAELASPGPWRSCWETDGEGVDMYLITENRNLVNGCCDGDGYFDNTDDARHIASWHPAVALAVAEWLEDEAEDIPPHADHYKGGPLSKAPAVRVARAYLGEAS